MEFRLLSKHGEAVAGIAAILGPVLAFVFCIYLDGRNVYVKPGHSFQIWLIFSVSSAIYYLGKTKGSRLTGGYVNPLFKAAMDLAALLPFLGLVLSGLKDNDLIQSYLWKSAVAASSTFLDNVVVLFLAASLGAGITSLKSYLQKKEGI